MNIIELVKGLDVAASRAVFRLKYPEIIDDIKYEVMRCEFDSNLTPKSGAITAYFIIKGTHQAVHAWTVYFNKSELIRLPSPMMIARKVNNIMDIVNDDYQEWLNDSDYQEWLNEEEQENGY